jgi:hypothetical protein
MQKLENLGLGNSPTTEPEEAVFKRIEGERLSTEKALQLRVKLSQHIDELQRSIPKDDAFPRLSDPSPTSSIPVSEGLTAYKGHISDQLLVSTLPKLFHAHALSRPRLMSASAQITGSLSDEAWKMMRAGQYARHLGITTGEMEAEQSNSHPGMGKASKITDKLLQLSSENSTDGSGECLSGHLSTSETQMRETAPEPFRSQKHKLVIKDDEQQASATVHQLEDGNDSADSDLLSDSSSLWEAQTGQLSSVTSGPAPGFIRLSIQELSDVVLERTELARILTASASHPSLQPEIVLEEFKRLMEYYCRDISSTSNASEYKRVSQLLKRSRGIIVNNARKLLGLVHTNLIPPNQRAKMTPQEKIEMLNYLWQLTMDVQKKQNEISDICDNINEESDSDDSSSFGGDLRPEISAAIAFLKDGVPMQRFQAQMRRFILDAAWKYDVLRGSTSLPSSLPYLVDDIWCRLRLSLPERSVPRGKRRIRWTCVS